MNKIDILKELNKMKNEENNFLSLLKLIEKLEAEVKEENFITKPSDKKKISAIKKILNKHNGNRPALECFTRCNNYLAFTDSYSAYYLKDDYLPFKYASSNEESNDDVKEYTKKYNLEYFNGVYPNMKSFLQGYLDNKELKEVEININEFLKNYKLADKKNIDSRTFEFSMENGVKIYYDSSYLKYAIDILKLDKDFKIKYTDVYRPLYIENDKKEIALILPIRKY